MQIQFRKLAELQKFLKVKKSPIAGRGLFTFRPLAGGEVVFRGRRSEGCYLIRHLNHCCNPNAKFLEKHPKHEYDDLLVAIKAIKSGQEITIDIRGTRWAEYYWPIVQKNGCRCPICARR